jgi:hypothetical protein
VHQEEAFHCPISIQTVAVSEWLLPLIVTLCFESLEERLDRHDAFKKLLPVPCSLVVYVLNCNLNTVLEKTRMVMIRVVYFP